MLTYADLCWITAGVILVSFYVIFLITTLALDEYGDHQYVLPLPPPQSIPLSLPSLSP
jgi:hypothetical protein